MTTYKRLLLICFLVVACFAAAIPGEEPKQVNNRRNTPTLADDISKEEETRHTPASSVIAAYKDAVALAAIELGHAPTAEELEKTKFSKLEVSYYRYISLYNFPKARRKEQIETLNFLIGSLNSEDGAPHPVVVLPDTDDTVVRIKLDDYGIKTEVWDNFVDNGSGPDAAAFPEPYFHVDVIIKDADDYKEKTVTDQYGKEKVVKEKVGTKSVTERRPAPWLPAKEINELYKVLATYNPVIRGDWFVAYASLPPAYYDLLNLGKTEADFQKAAFFDIKLAEQIRNATKGVVRKSGVALHNRALIRYPSVSGILQGYYWESNDFKKSVRGADSMANLLKQKVDAKEIIATLRNGLQFYFLVNGKGERVDFADPQIANDRESKWEDKLVYSGRNCMACHSAGMRSITDDVRRIASEAPGGKVNLLIPYTLKKESREVGDKFFQIDINTATDFDKALFAASLKRHNGLDPVTNATQFEWFSVNYLDRMIDLDIAAMEAGIAKDKLKTLIETGKLKIKAGEKVIAQNLDHTLTTLIGKDPGNTVRRDQWEAKGFPQMMLLIEQESKQPKEEVKEQPKPVEKERKEKKP